MGCGALVRIRPQQLVADHTNKPEMARQCHATFGKPAVGDGQRDKSAVNGAAGGSKNVADVNTQQCNQGSREADDHLATCSSDNQAPAAPVRHSKHYIMTTSQTSPSWPCQWPLQSNKAHNDLYIQQQFPHFSSTTSSPHQSLEFVRPCEARPYILPCAFL